MAADKIIFEKCPIKPGCICDSHHAANASTAIKLEYEKAWSFVDAIYCICLITRPDRLIEASEQMHTYGLCRRVVFHRPHPPPKEVIIKHQVKHAGSLGCWEAHRMIAQKVTQQAYKDNKDQMFTLVFEDDVYFLPKLMSAERIHDVASSFRRVLTGPGGGDIYYLGHFPLAGMFVDSHTVRSISNAAHAYIASLGVFEKLSQKSYLDEMINGKSKGPQIDSWYLKNFKQYAYYPQIAVQSISSSDNLSESNKNKTRSLQKMWRHHAWKFYMNYSHIIEYVVFFVLPIILLLFLVLLIYGVFRIVQPRPVSLLTANKKSKQWQK